MLLLLLLDDPLLVWLLLEADALLVSLLLEADASLALLLEADALVVRRLLLLEADALVVRLLPPKASLEQWTTPWIWAAAAFWTDPSILQTVHFFFNQIILSFSDALLIFVYLILELSFWNRTNPKFANPKFTKYSFSFIYYY